ncbi:PorP/SprF family type IX secretion system membrane protein [Ascidiimonas sp. W6]|uniref:PorP/SprF family type IX secretion system membrane protein n=1 Tax=Ascidiimonas meishanensis TaxID=3128903 RepID=UPI0030EEC2E5
MIKKISFFIFVLLYGLLQAQQSVLPVDWRQHNLAKYNDNVFNPALSFVRNEQMNLSLWGRIQWVNVEDSPRTYFINYSGKAGEKSGAGLALFQHNIGLFTDSGLMANYARGIQLARESWLTFGINIIAFKRGLNEANFITPQPDPSILEGKDDFILALMPGINLTLDRFNIGITSENLFDYNLSSSGQQTDFGDKIFLGYSSYDFKVGQNSSSWKNSILRTTIYAKTIPNQDLQYGLGALMDVPEYGWIQAGYNNFYGISGGLGAKVSKGIAVGFLIETGTRNTNQAFGATYEITAAIEFGNVKGTDEQLVFKEGPKPVRRRKVTSEEENQSLEIIQNKEVSKNEEIKEVTAQVSNKETDKVETSKPAIISEENLAKESLKVPPKRSRRRVVVSNEEEEVVVLGNKKESTPTGVLKTSLQDDVNNDNIPDNANKSVENVVTDVLSEKNKDTLNFDNIQQMEIKQLESYAIDKNTDRNVLNALFKEQVENTRYKVVERIEGVEYGFYLVVNVFAQKKYFDLFMRLLSAQSLDPKSFYNPDNNYYYVYLKKYDKLSEAEQDRRSSYNGSYTGETWILWVRAN